MCKSRLIPYRHSPRTTIHYSNTLTQDARKQVPNKNNNNYNINYIMYIIYFQFWHVYIYILYLPLYII